MGLALQATGWDDNDRPQGRRHAESFAPRRRRPRPAGGISGPGGSAAMSMPADLVDPVSEKVLVNQLIKVVDGRVAAISPWTRRPRTGLSPTGRAIMSCRA